MDEPMTFWERTPERIKKTIKGALIALAGLGLTVMQEKIPGIDFGSWTGTVVVANSIIVQAGRQIILYLIADDNATRM